MSALEGLEECNLHRRTPYGIRNVIQTQFSIARHYGGIKYNGDSYIYIPETDELIRTDVWQWKWKREKKAKKEAGK